MAEVSEQRSRPLDVEVALMTEGDQRRINSGPDPPRLAIASRPVCGGSAGHWLPWTLAKAPRVHLRSERIAGLSVSAKRWRSSFQARDGRLLYPFCPILQP